LTIDRQGGRRRVVIEQAAVEVPDVLDAKIAAGSSISAGWRGRG